MSRRQVLKLSAVTVALFFWQFPNPLWLLLPTEAYFRLPDRRLEAVIIKGNQISYWGILAKQDGRWKVGTEFRTPFSTDPQDDGFFLIEDGRILKSSDWPELYQEYLNRGGKL